MSPLGRRKDAMKGLIHAYNAVSVRISFGGRKAPPFGKEKT